METDASLARRAGVVLILFFSVCIAIVVYLFTGTPVQVPLLEQSRDYTISVNFTDIDNLVPAGQVRIAGVEVGEVRSVETTPRGMDVTMAFDKMAAPLHQGASVRLGARSVVEEGYLEVTDGHGPALLSGSHLPDSAAVPSVQLRDILHDLDPKTRADLGSALRELGAGTAGTQQQVDAIFTGFGKLGRDGHTALDAIAAQSGDLRQLVPEVATLMDALDGSDGDIGRLVSTARRITDATSAERPNLEATIRKLPGVLDSAKTATAKLTELAAGLQPVAVNLNQAGPPLSQALRELPSTSRKLREVLSPLNGALDRAPPTLNRTPRFGRDLRPVISPAREILREAVPIAGYVRPYGPEFAAFFANFSSIFQYRGENGVHYFRLLVLGNESVFQTPSRFGVVTYNNPYPQPGRGANPGPFKARYPHVERMPR